MSLTSIVKAGLRRLELALESVPEAVTVEEIAVAVEDVQAAVAAVAEVVVAEAAAAVVAEAGMEATAAAAVAEGDTNFFVTDSRGLKPRFMKRAATFVAAFFFCEFLLRETFLQIWQEMLDRFHREQLDCVLRATAIHVCHPKRILTSACGRI